MHRARIAVDAMGGDYAPQEIVAGVLLAAAEFDATILLVGDEGRVRPLLRGPAADLITVVHAPEAVAMDLTPSTAIRSCERTSLGVAVNLIKRGDADAVVSAGNSGAFLAIAMVKLRTIEGISRPAIATVWPALNGPTVLLDSGANVDCRPEWLEQFAIMGSAYAKAVLNVPEPRVGILSVGEERSKGNQLVLEAARLLEVAPVKFIGNVEGGDLFHNVADVIVTDGFVGNVVLKTGEGLFADLARVMRDTLWEAASSPKLEPRCWLPRSSACANDSTMKRTAAHRCSGCAGTASSRTVARAVTRSNMPSEPPCKKSTTTSSVRSAS